MYVQLLSTFIWLFGSAPSVALLINLFCSLGTVAILVHWSRTQPRTATAAALAIVAITFSPAFVLWSLQALKDPFFQLLFVAFVAACAAWARVARARTMGGACGHRRAADRAALRPRRDPLVLRRGARLRRDALHADGRRAGGGAARRVPRGGCRRGVPAFAKPRRQRGSVSPGRAARDAQSEDGVRGGEDRAGVGAR